MRATQNIRSPAVRQWNEDMRQAAIFAIAVAVVGIIALSRISVDHRTTGLQAVVDRLIDRARAAESRGGPPAREQARRPVN
jgi:hypothetical protein